MIYWNVSFDFRLNVEVQSRRQCNMIHQSTTHTNRFPKCSICTRTNVSIRHERLACPSNETAIKFVPTKYALQIPSKWWKAIFYDFRFSLRSTLLLSVPGHDTLCTQALTGLTPNVNIYRENGNLLLFQLKLENRTGCTNRPHQLWFPANHPRRAHISRMHWETNQTVNKARKLRVKRLAINGFCADCGHPKKK